MTPSVVLIWSRGLRKLSTTAIADKPRCVFVIKPLVFIVPKIGWGGPPWPLFLPLWLGILAKLSKFDYKTTAKVKIQIRPH